MMMITRKCFTRKSRHRVLSVTQSPMPLLCRSLEHVASRWYQALAARARTVHTLVAGMEGEGSAMPEAEAAEHITEGAATILVRAKNEVFYNPVQEFNRDMSIACIRAYCDMLSEDKEVGTPLL